MSGGRAAGAAYPWWTELAAWCGAQALRLLGHSWRIERVNMAAVEARVAAGEPCIYAFWHARLLPLVFTHRSRGIAVLVSRHRDGQLIARIVERMGFVTARGSSTRGGEEGLREMLEWAGKGRLLTLSPDGPRGPAEQVKPGLVYLASRTGFMIVPVAAAAAAEWRLRSWDGFRIPRPFGRVVVGYGEPIAIPAELERSAIEARCVEVGRAIARLTEDLDRRAAGAE